MSRTSTAALWLSGVLVGFATGTLVAACAPTRTVDPVRLERCMLGPLESPPGLDEGAVARTCLHEAQR